MSGYNGWSNYETWATKLWMDNDYGTYEYWREATQEAEGDAYALSHRLKDELDDGAPDLGANMYADLLNAALSEVDWLEIARSLLTEHED